MKNALREELNTLAATLLLVSCGGQTQTARDGGQDTKVAVQPDAMSDATSADGDRSDGGCSGFPETCCDVLPDGCIGGHDPVMQSCTATGWVCPSGFSMNCESLCGQGSGS
jgi:hypothetical protein